MRSRLIVCLLICAGALAPAALRAQKNGGVQIWLTNADKSALFEQGIASFQCSVQRQSFQINTCKSVSKQRALTPLE
jgi:hypothetical protein